MFFGNVGKIKRVFQTAVFNDDFTFGTVSVGFHAHNPNTAAVILKSSAVSDREGNRFGFAAQSVDCKRDTVEFIVLEKAVLNKDIGNHFIIFVGLHVDTAAGGHLTGIQKLALADSKTVNADNPHSETVVVVKGDIFNQHVAAGRHMTADGNTVTAGIFDRQIADFDIFAARKKNTVPPL